MSHFVDASGKTVSPKDLQITKAQELTCVLASGSVPFVQFVGCQRSDSDEFQQVRETVVFDAEVELPQHPMHDIRRYERVAVVFDAHDEIMPQVLALRSDFPRVGHLNLSTEEIPRSLCLYETPYSELKLQWTAAGFIGRIREWFAKTAQETLHAEDQPLEQLLIGGFCPIVLPPDLCSGNNLSMPDRLDIYRVDSRNGRTVFIANPILAPTPDQAEPTFVAIGVQGQSQQHGIIRRQPANLPELAEFLAQAGINLRDVMRERLRDWADNPHLLKSNLVLVAVLPKIRREGETPETPDVWAFMFTTQKTESQTNKIKSQLCSIREIGQQIGLWSEINGKLGLLLPPDEDQNGAEIRVTLLNPTYKLSRELASLYNGQQIRTEHKMVLVGAGALGSQIFLNLIRSGFGEWSLIDNDYILPHNLAKNALFGMHTGFSKVDCLAELANETIYGNPIATPIAADVLIPRDAADQVKQSFHEASLILDCSASVAVARHLACDIKSSARRVSLFLNPSGSDCVLLAEDAQRAMPLDWLEMQYYRQLIASQPLSDHMQQPNGRIRYAMSCRDISSNIPQDLVALHAANGSRSIHNVALDDAAKIRIWRTSLDGFAVQEVVVEPSPVIIYQLHEWRLCIDQWLLDKIGNLRKAKLPNETGGILIGSHDMQRKMVYVVDILPSPPDSYESRTSYVRGFQGLQQRISEISTQTIGMINYVGEWHSHPDKCGVDPSDKDRDVFEWLSDIMQPESQPPLMLIVAENRQFGWHLSQISG